MRWGRKRESSNMEDRRHGVPLSLDLLGGPSQYCDA